MYRLIIACLLLALAGCNGNSPAERIPGFRDAGLGMYSNAVLDPARLVGDWQQVAAFSAPNGANCAPGGVHIAQVAPTQFDMTARLCLSGDDISFKGRADMPVPGRLTLSGADPAGIGQPWWIVWVDVNYRTLVIGTPSGQFGFILNRGGPIPGDRIAAASDILAWNGYDLTKLRYFK